MQLSRFKPREELAFALQGKRRLAIFACTVCANFSRTGGHAGIRYMKGILQELDKEIVVSHCITGCCLENVLRATFDRTLPSIAHRLDALVMLSCSSGVKTAFLFSPGIPVIAACDTLGSRPVSLQTNNICDTLCKGCERCIISYTGGICPRRTCPRSLFGPCKAAPLNQEESVCSVNPHHDCVWKEIISRGVDLQALAYLKSMPLPTGVLSSGRKRPRARRVITRFFARVLSLTSGLISRIILWLE